MRRVPNASSDVLSQFVAEHVEPGAEVQTDAWNGYCHLSSDGFLHHVVNIAASGDPAHVAMPQVHRVASLLKRWLLGTYQGAISHSHLDYYLDEFTFRFNRRGSRHRGLLFYRLIEGALRTDPKSAFQNAFWGWSSLRQIKLQPIARNASWISSRRS
jgi:transposase-like protein